MATSPRDIVTVTTELRKAVHGFFVQQGITDESLAALGEDSPYGMLVKVSNREYHIRKYAADVIRAIKAFSDDSIGGTVTEPVEGE